MAELLDLPDEMLKKVVPKIGPWNRLCKAKRNLQEKYSKVATELKPDKMTDFLHDLGLHQYVSVFKGKEWNIKSKHLSAIKFTLLNSDEEMDFDDLMKISLENLKQIVPKMGPVNKILDARKDLLSKNGLKGGSNSNYYSSDEEDQVAQPEVFFIEIMLTKYLY